jgi:hypothetical protein
MADQFVLFPPGILAVNQQCDAIQLLATIGRFARPDGWLPNQLERDLEIRFAGRQNVSFADAAAWLRETGIRFNSSGNPISLLQVLQNQNDAGALQLLEVLDASKLVELEDGGETALTPRPLWSRAEPCLLLRLGYNTGSGYAYYAASLPGDSRRPIKLTWKSIVAATISNTLTVFPPAKTVEIQAIADALHIMEQALATAAAAHATILAALGQHSAQPTIPERAPAAPAGEQAAER